MDEMRQLVRILTKLLPHSVPRAPTAAEGGGGNRMSEEQIRDYLRCTLGQAPQPDWGLRDGWARYIAGAGGAGGGAGPGPWEPHPPSVLAQSVACCKQLRQAEALCLCL